MLNLYAVLGVPAHASDEALQAAIAQAQTTEQLPPAVLKSACFYLLDGARRQAYNQALLKAEQNQQLTTDWRSELSKQQTLVPATPNQTAMAILQAVTVPPTQARAQTATTKPKARMKKRHWLGLVVCLAVTGVLVTVLWEMAQVQQHQSQQVEAANQLIAQQRPPEHWPTWHQQNGQTFLNATNAPHTRLAVHQNNTQDLPVLSLPAHTAVDCGERGNQHCAVTLVFDGQDPHTFKAQIIGTTLVFNHMPQWPMLMSELSQATRIQAFFPQVSDLPDVIFEKTDASLPTPTPSSK